jgi:uncharacterized membrane protein YkvA (DUF1232 family)
MQGRLRDTIHRLKDWARGVSREVVTLHLARNDPRVPWYAKALAICIVAYAVSPIDLIPDFIPILGYVDDLLILPLGILLVVRLIPPPVLDEYRDKAATLLEQPKGRAAAVVIAVIWLACLGLLALVSVRWATR